ncbi:type I-E CRISPR-associated protein Cse2/CasB [Enemella sp. A6]|uniref:type I-E CRISPR-associated protein Cse2/CasB n=1 Tax=Enemella sp. A6 TaxID=3440152 RepID=UPI003EC12FF7
MTNDHIRCGKFVAQRIRYLLGDNPANPRPTSRAMLAQLRQAAAQEPGTVPSVWSVTTEGLPELPEPMATRVETAIHIALTQFATHQQARSTSMHVPDVPFGQAVRRLANLSSSEGEPQESPVYARFTALSMTTAVPGILAHSRGIITQLRSHDIGFDYERYADDLYWLQVPGSAGSVHRRWGRDFHRFVPPTTTDTTAIEGVSA